MHINRKTLRPNIIYRFNFSYRSVGLGIYSLLQSIHSYCDGSSDRSLTVDPLSYLAMIQAKRGMCYLICGMLHIKYPLLLLEENSSRSDGSGFPLSLSDLLCTTCPTEYNRIYILY